jgi:hypothetical protein
LSGGESAQLSLIVGYICIVDEIPKVGSPKIKSNQINQKD